MKWILLKLTIVLFLISFFPPVQLKANERSARVNFIKNEVFKADGNNWVRIWQVGSLLKENDTVKTGDNSKLEIRFDDGSLMQMSSNATMSLKQYKLTKEGRDSDINLQNGSVFVNINKLKKKSSFKVSTITAVAGVRGTEFYVSVDKNQNVKVEVYKGKVEVARADDTEQKVEVKAGYETEVVGDSKPSDPKKIVSKRKVEWSK